MSLDLVALIKVRTTIFLGVRFVVKFVIWPLVLTFSIFTVIIFPGLALDTILLLLFILNNVFFGYLRLPFARKALNGLFLSLFLLIVHNSLIFVVVIIVSILRAVFGLVVRTTTPMTKTFNHSRQFDWCVRGLGQFSLIVHRCVHRQLQLPEDYSTRSRLICPFFGLFEFRSLFTSLPATSGCCVPCGNFISWRHLDSV